MEIIKRLSNYLAPKLGINEEYILLFFYTILTIIIIKLLTKITIKIQNKISKNEKKIYTFNKKMQIIGTFTTFILLLLIWEKHIENIIYIISFVSAGIALSLKEFIINFFAGIYIRFSKPFNIEDRILINEIEGDVVNINTMSFEILEVSNKEKGEQSTGVIIHVPNSAILTSPLKNYTKVFKYIWNEISINLPIDADLKNTKSEIYRIVNKNEILKHIPKKMKNQLNNAVTNYRIFYNKLEPIIYIKIVDNHIVLNIRYLVHPKKARNVENEILNQILQANQEGKIELLK